MKSGQSLDLAGARPRLAATMADSGDASSAVDSGGGPSEGRGRAASGRSSSGRSWHALVESIALGFLLPVVGWLINRRDPFFETRAFSWYVLPPLLAGLRHGFAGGCASTATLGAWMLIGWRLHVFGGAAFPGEALIGTLVAAMVSGHVSDVWLRETARTFAVANHARRRANEIARAHLLLQLSHERLQEQSPGVSNLREALTKIDGAGDPAPLAWPTIAHQVMALVGRFTSVEAATLIQADVHGTLGPVLANLGDVAPVSADDPIVREALRSRQITAVTGVGPRAYGPSAGAKPAQASGLLAVVPIIDSGGVLHGVLCLESMPFFAFTRRNLEAAAVLVGHFADRVSSSESPDEPHRERERTFLDRLDRALEETREGRAPAVLGLLAVVAGSPLATISDIILSGILAPDHVVHRTRHRHGDTFLWLLLPRAGEADVRAIMERIGNLVQQELERTLAQAGGSAIFRFLTARDERVTVMAELERDMETSRGRR